MDMSIENWSGTAGRPVGLIIRQKDPNNFEMPFDQLGDFITPVELGASADARVSTRRNWPTGVFPSRWASAAVVRKNCCGGSPTMASKSLIMCAWSAKPQAKDILDASPAFAASAIDITAHHGPGGRMVVTVTLADGAESSEDLAAAADHLLSGFQFGHRIVFRKEQAPR
jgi:hypothetical protein